MPRERPEPDPFEASWLTRSLDRYLIAGLLFMALLIAGFITYQAREPSLRAAAARTQQTDYTNIGRRLFADNCAECHGPTGEGGGSAPTLHSKQFLGGTSDGQIHSLIAGGISGTDMSAWSLDFGGTLTDDQVNAVVTYLRSLAAKAPSVPDWRTGGSAGG